MALLGTDDILAQSIVTYVSEENAAQGLQPATIQAFASGIAKALIEHLLTYGGVAPGIVVATSGGAGATSTPGTFI